MKDCFSNKKYIIYSHSLRTKHKLKSIYKSKLFLTDLKKNLMAKIDLATTFSAALKRNKEIPTHTNKFLTFYTYQLSKPHQI